MRIVIVFLIALMHLHSNAQELDISKHSPSVYDRPMFQKEIEYRWPYFYRVPRYIGVIGGYEGFGSHFYKAGIAFNGFQMPEAFVGGMAGGMLMYKREFRDDAQSFEAEFGGYNIVCLGFNFNYNMQGDHHTFGVRPVIGLSLFHCQLLYGYNIFSRKNQIQSLRHHTFEIRYVLPLFKLKDKHQTLVPDYPSYYPELSSDYRIDY